MQRYKHPLGGPADKIVAYCRYHKCSMTLPQMRQRECLRKGCGALRKDDHPYWKSREVTREKRAARKREKQAVLHSLKGEKWK